VATKSTPKPARPGYRCGECGWEAAKWVGRCGECQAWGTVEEVGAPKLGVVAAGPVSAPARPIGEVDLESARAVATGIGELDRVLGGGLVPGSVVLLTGEPGVGKSTLLLETASATATLATPSLYVTGEESASQVRLRAERVGALSDHLYLAAETDLSAVIAHIDAVKPALMILDSVQTISTALVEGATGGLTQVREVAGALIRVAKDRGIAMVLVGHVTKDGTIAGPRTLEHLVDVVLHVEGDRHGRLRFVRAVKNRYGAADEVGCFELTDTGIAGVSDPSMLFMSDRDNSAAGTAVSMALEGNRPLAVEVQALLGPNNGGSPRRSTSGLDSARTAMVLAVLEARCKVPVGQSDVYAATVGGVRLTEPAHDLALALAIAGSWSGRPLWHGLIVMGEVGLAGEIRRVTSTSRRLAEAARLGFTRALVPVGSGDAPAGLKVKEVSTLTDALQTVGILQP